MKKEEISFEASFHTPEIPAPYSFEYLIKGTLNPSAVSLEFDLKYTGREGLTEEEILDEGFTMNDNFSWKGELNEIWANYLSGIINKTRCKAGSNKTEALHLKITKAENQTETQGFPVNFKEWDYTLQELMQAIFEKAGKEAPLHLTYLHVAKNKKIKVTINGQFTERRLNIEVSLDGGKETTRIIGWERLGEILKPIFLPEYLPEHSTEKEPGKEGNYIDIGEGVWYKLGTAVKNPSKKTDAVGKIEKLFSELIAEVEN